MEFITAKFYAKPDGEDYVGKMLASNRFILMGLTPLATSDVLMLTKPKGYLSTIACFAKWFGPAIGMASAFTTVSYAAYHIRGKDDW
jgi:NADH dehydrogenase (ubiquinone) 1 alpha subcomplex subunit 11